MKSLFAILLCLGMAAHAWAKPLQVEDMHKFLRVSEAQLSPDGKWVAFTAARSDVDKNKMVRNLWIVSANGGDARALTFAEKGSNMRPRWSPDSRWLYFLSSRSQDTTQIFRLPLSGGEAKQITNTSIGIDSFVLSPDGKTIAFTSTVFPDCTVLSCSEKKAKEKEESSVKARMITQVPMRRWDTWIDGKRNHIFVMPAEGGEAIDITPGDMDSPIWSEGGGEEVAFSPDGKEICFSRYVGNEAFEGNSNLFTIPVTGGNAVPITTNPAADTTPLYSPDGQYIAYTATLRPNQETDQPRLFLYNRKTKEHTNLTEKFDRPVMSYIWHAESKSLSISLEDRGQVSILKLDVNGNSTPVYGEGTSSDIQVSTDAKFLVFSNSDISNPAELFRMDLAAGAKPVALTKLNADALKNIDMGEHSSFTFAGWNNEQVQSWQVKPPGFDANKKYPLVLLMHGGPESAWLNQFHYRWNAQLFAARGYVVIAPNFHGSVSFGLKFMDAIKGNWGGAPYEDQMKAVDEAAKWPYVDATRLAAAGASYGGYMANWVAGQTDRFRTIVNHDGLFDLMGAWFSADLPGGIDKELKGTPWENPQPLIEHSPLTFVKNWKTPMLVIHGEKDYRVDLSQGIVTFQLLQAMKIPSKLVLFPDENHWVLKPANSILWYNTVLDWIDQWTLPEAPVKQ